MTNAEKLEGINKKIKIFKNEEIKNLINALGFNTNEVYEGGTEKLRYGKVIIMTDADNDGAHIALLLATFFFKYFSKLINENKIFLSVAPLYKLQNEPITTTDFIELILSLKQYNQSITLAVFHLQVRQYKSCNCNHWNLGQHHITFKLFQHVIPGNIREFNIQKY